MSRLLSSFFAASVLLLASVWPCIPRYAWLLWGDQPGFADWYSLVYLSL